MKTKFYALFLAILLLPALHAFAQDNTWTIDASHSQAGFEVRHMGVSNVRGSLSNVSGTVVWDKKDITKSTVNVVIDATTVNTTSAYRDKDLKSDAFFNVEKYPTLTFKSTSIKRVGKGLKITGDLTLTGVTKSVTLDVDGPTDAIKGMQGGLVSGLSATTTINRTDFNFGSKYPSAVIGNEVKITIDAELNQK